MIAAVYKITSKNGQTHDGPHIYAHDRHCRAVLPAPAERGYLATCTWEAHGLAMVAGAPRQGSLGTNVTWSGSEFVHANLQERDKLPTKDKKPVPNVSVTWKFHCTCSVSGLWMHNQHAYRDTSAFTATIGLNRECSDPTTWLVL